MILPAQRDHYGRVIIGNMGNGNFHVSQSHFSKDEKALKISCSSLSTGPDKDIGTYNTFTGM